MRSVENRTIFKRTIVVCANNETNVISIIIGRFVNWVGELFFFIEKYAAAD